MNDKQVLGSAPRELRYSMGQLTISYQLADELIATHGGSPGNATVLALANGAISVQPATLDPEEGRGAAILGPVYRQVPGGRLTVPTGRALVRYAEGESPVRRRNELAAAGYELEQVLPYAAHAGWVRATSGEIVDTLRNLHRLERLPGVERVEPEMIAEVTPRDD